MGNVWGRPYVPALSNLGLKQKKGGARSAAKFREETSKKQGGTAALLQRTMGICGGDCKP